MMLEGTVWAVTHLDGAAVVRGREPTIAFEGGRALGTTGCNRWFCAYRVDDDTLAFGPAGSTMMMCADPRVMEQETDFLRMLDRVEGFALADGVLTLSDAEGGPLLRATLQDPSA